MARPSSLNLKSLVFLDGRLKGGMTTDWRPPNAGLGLLFGWRKV
jgi:hypothetical protein